jgi:hypothetical protein
MVLLAQHRQLLSVAVAVVVQVTLAGHKEIMVLLVVLRNSLQLLLLVEVLGVFTALEQMLEVLVIKPMLHPTIGLVVVQVLLVVLEQMQHDREPLMAVSTVLQETELPLQYTQVVA